MRSKNIEQSFLLSLLLAGLFFSPLLAIAQDAENVAEEPNVAEVVAADEAAAEDQAAEEDPVADEDQAAATNKSKPPFARIVRIPLPIKGTVDTDVRQMFDQILATAPKNADERPIIVLEFWPPVDGDGATSEFGRSLDLARYIASAKTAGVRTVSYIPKTVKGHAVLVALATEQIIMHPEAQIGAAGINEETIGPTVRRGYTEIADRRRTIPSAIALGMLDTDLQVQRVNTGMGVRYVLAEDVPEIQRNTNVQSIDTVIPAGRIGLLAADKLRLDFGFVSHLAQDKKELAAALNVPVSDLEVDPSFGGEWVAARIDIDGPISNVMVNRVMSGIDEQMNRDPVNFIAVVIDSPGGNTEESIRLATYLSDMDSAKIRTVAYVTNEALADAGLIAISCDQLVMNADARLGGDGARVIEEDDIELATLAIQEMAKSKNRTWSLPAAIIDPELSVYKYQLADSPVTDIFCDQELKQQEDPERWQEQEEISPQGEVLQLTGVEAKELGLARHTVDNYGEFIDEYHLKETPKTIKPNWAHELIGALASPQVAGGLLFIGFFAMMAEMSAPGLSIGGFIAAVCFLLFFWSNFLQGTAGWLEVLLFMAGIIFIAMEVLVLPGFGIFGLGGGFMVIASLVLASQTFVIPRNDYQLAQLPQSMFTVVAAMAGVGTAGYMLRNVLAKAPIFRRTMLAPPEGEEALARQARESVVQWEHLLGQIGKAMTPLVPAGKADFDGELIDVVSDGVAVDKNAIVEVIEVAGNRVVVKEKKV